MLTPTPKKRLLSKLIKRFVLLGLLTQGALLSHANAATPAHNNSQAAPLNEDSIVMKEEEKDPLEEFNRDMYQLNDMLDKYIATPTSTLYNKIVPRPLNSGIHNFFTNFNETSVIGNDLLQANLYQATSDTWRLAVNTIIGVGGLFDVASSMGLPSNDETFGLTMAKWGWKKSTYVVLPFFGPNTIRSSIGKVPDWLMTAYPYMKNETLRDSLFVVEYVDIRASLLQYQGVFNQAAFDPYVFMRNAYLQRQQYLIEQNSDLSDPYTPQDTSTDEEEDDYLSDF